MSYILLWQFTSRACGIVLAGLTSGYNSFGIYGEEERKSAGAGQDFQAGKITIRLGLLGHVTL